MAYDAGPQARQILDDCDDDLKDWRPDYDNEGGFAVQDKEATSPTLQGNSRGGDAARVDDTASLQTDLRTEDGSESVARTQTSTV